MNTLLDVAAEGGMPETGADAGEAAVADLHHFSLETGAEGADYQRGMEPPDLSLTLHPGGRGATPTACAPEHLNQPIIFCLYPEGYRNRVLPY